MYGGWRQLDWVPPQYGLQRRSVGFFDHEAVFHTRRVNLRHPTALAQRNPVFSSDRRHRYRLANSVFSTKEVLL